jgi:hypothetical protein
VNLFSLNLGYKSRSDWVSIILGACFGLMPVTAYSAPLIVVLMSLFLGVPNITRRSFILGFFVIQYCLVQYFYLQYHGSSPVWDFDLIKVYAVLSVAAVPFAALVGSHLLDLKKFEVGYFWGIGAAAAVLGYQYFFEHQCRAVGFTSNPLIPPFILIPLLGYILARRVSEGRSSGMDFGVIVLGIMIAGLFPGGRMGFYSISLVLVVMGLFTIVKLNWRRAVLIWGALAFGVFATIAIDGNSRCNFLGRISSQFRIATDLNESLQSPSNAALLEPKVEVERLAGDVIEGKLDDVTAPVSVVSDDPELDASDIAMEVMHRSEHSSAQRWFMWTNAVSRIAAYRVEWLTGIGWINEASVVNRGFNMSYKHAHNQILSWLLWGGLPSLLSAVLLFGVLPLRAFRHFPSTVFVFASGLGFLTNSLMLSGQAVSGFVLSVLLVLTVEWRARE